MGHAASGPRPARAAAWREDGEAHGPDHSPSARRLTGRRVGEAVGGHVRGRASHPAPTTADSAANHRVLDRTATAVSSSAAPRSAWKQLVRPISTCRTASATCKRGRTQGGWAVDVRLRHVRTATASTAWFTAKTPAARPVRRPGSGWRGRRGREGSRSRWSSPPARSRSSTRAAGPRG
jgi:hypothetical protein